jgi:peptidoglycan/LPS O-acetylase OafA/YrhL
MRGLVVLLCVAAAGSVVAAVANGLAGDALGAIPPAILAVLFAFGAYRQVKHPVKPQPWTRTRVVVSAVFGGALTLAVLATLGWTAISVPDWPIRAVSVAGIVFVVCLVIWVVRIARRMDREARALES